jgi:hypothetical protein
VVSERTLFDLPCEAPRGLPDVQPGEHYRNPITGTVWRVLHLRPRVGLVPARDRFAVVWKGSRRIYWRPRYFFVCLELV